MGMQQNSDARETIKTFESRETQLQSQKLFSSSQRTQHPQLLQQIIVDMKIPHMDDDLKKRNHGMCGLSYCTTLYLCLTVALMLAVVCTSSIFLYDEYTYAQPQKFQGWCAVPMNKEVYQLKKYNDYNNDDVEIFREEFDIGLVDDLYANVDVPDFQDGKRGRFIHDFKANMTGIVDIEGGRCFVMSLDRAAVLPPVSLVDVLKKMMDGYYNVDINFVKQNMRVVTPPIKNLSGVGIHIARECNNLPVYALEKYTHSVAKRSVDEPVVKFREFAGNFLQEFNIININEVTKYEEESKVV